MAVQDTTHHRTLSGVAEVRTIAPDASDRHDHEHHHEDDDHEHGHDHDHSFEWMEALRITLVALAAAAVWFRVWEPFPAVSVIGIAGLLIGGWPILKEAFENMLERRMTMELSMTIAVVAAAAIGEFFTALVITLFVLVAEVLEGLTVGRGRKAIRDLLEFLPREVSVRRAGSIYLLKESFGQLWSYEREGWARRFFENWRASLKWQRLKPYEKFAVMIDRHWDGIAAYCRPENKVSLGFVEGLNNKIRVIQRRAYGLRDEDYLRLKI
jgi:hypothetical protein